MNSETRIESTPDGSSSAHEGTTWATEQDQFAITQPAEHVRLLLPEQGVISGALRFRLVREYLDHAAERTQWSLLDPEPSAGSPGLGGVVVVVREEQLTEEVEPHGVHRIVDAWIVPAALVPAPSALVGHDGAAFEDMLGLHMFQRIRISHSVQPQDMIPIEPAAAIDPRVIEIAAEAAARVAERTDLVVTGLYDRVAYSYEESVANNLNETVSNSWRWRIGFRIELRGVEGLLVLALAAGGVDTHENRWQQWLNEQDILGWVVLPSQGADDDLLSEGVPLDAYLLAAT